MKTFFLLIVIVLLGLSLVYWYKQQVIREGVSIEEVGEKILEAPLSEETKEGESLAFQPFSIPAYREKEYDGRDFVIGKTLAENTAYTQSAITYKSGNLTISGIMDMPKGTPPSGGFPVLFLNHGFIDPAIYTTGRGLKREQDYLARRGYVIVHSDYRNHAGSDKDPDADVELRFGYVEDVINGILALKQAGLQNVNAEKIGMLGHSMGGGVTLSVLVIKPELVQAAVLFAPVSSDQRENFDRWLSRRPETAEKIQQRFGSPEDNPAFWDGISAMTFLSDIEAPLQLHHGTVDESVPIAWSDRLDQILREKEKRIEYYRYPGEPHEFINAWPTVMDRTVTLFDSIFSPSSVSKE